MSVSRVINGDSGVRKETRAIVDDAIRELNYTPNLMARSLVTLQEIRIGVIYSNPSAAFMSDFLAGVFDEASNRAAQLILLKGQAGGAPTADAVGRLLGSGIGGVILAPPLGEAAGLRRMLHDAALPVAVVGAVASDAISVGIDDHNAARDMTRHLIALGHRRIGFVVGNRGQQASIARLDGFRAAIADAGDVTATIVPGDFSYASGLIAGEQLLGPNDRPTAIFASNDDMAAAVVSVAHRRHLDIPADLTVTGFDDSTAAVTLWPPLTTIRQPVQQLAAEALQLLIREMRTGTPLPAEERLRVLEHVLVERQSTAPPPA